MERGVGHKLSSIFSSWALNVKHSVMQYYGVILPKEDGEVSMKNIKLIMIFWFRKKINERKSNFIKRRDMLE